MKNINNIFLLIVLVLVSTASFSQDIKGDIEKYLNNIIAEIPGSNTNDYTIPASDDLNSWGNVLGYMFNNQIESANDLANGLNYQIVDFQDTTLNANNRFYIIEEKKPRTKYWGTYIISANPSRNRLIIQAPHPIYDSNTGYQATFCFKRLQPKALFISGTHRCNHILETDCSGTTGACGSTGPYRVSDNAHNVNSVFQIFTKEIADNFDNTVFVQLHGFSKGANDPYLIMSNGTRVTPSVDYNALIRDGLLQADPSLTFKIANINTDWDRLIAFTNVQGRYINNSSDPCSVNASNSDGRFVHIEQERSKLRSDSVGWYKMYLAMKSAFDITTDIDPAICADNQLVEVYPNPNNGNFIIDLKDKAKSISIIDSHGKYIYKNSDVIAQALQINLKNQSPGIYFVRIVSLKGILQKKILLLK
ncbi:MAG: T9SS type A sorting domain-containing protein [Bacteroidota bacterium]